jgi:hypothetical protein
MHLINISLRFYSLSDRYKHIDKIIFIKDIVITIDFITVVYMGRDVWIWMGE